MRRFAAIFTTACSLLLVSAALFSAADPAPRAAPADASKGEDATRVFETRIRPLLAARCYACHGPKVQQAGLRLDSRAALLKRTEAGHLAVVPGSPETSALIQAIRYAGSVKMPPAGKLAPEDIGVLTQWVKIGAPWPEVRVQGSGFRVQGSASRADSEHPIPKTQHPTWWSFQPVQRPALPKAKNVAWCRTPIDRFILAELEKRGLQPAPAADRRTLIRRATFDLTGLPPTPAEIDAFVKDRSPGAWAKVVDRLLASPHFGERWARHWLDVVRYCDSFDARILGENNAGRIMDCADAWRYRDWVVNAFNQDMPYNRFLEEQIAGDLLPGGGAGILPVSTDPKGYNRDGIIATGVLALGNWGGGDADKEKLLTDIADDQVDLVSRAFMGLTVGCARCHDHKFDPIPTKDYYGLAGIFFSTHILENVGPKTNGPPMLRIPLASPAELARRKEYSDRVAALEKQLAAERESRYGDLSRQLLPETARYLVAAWDSTHSREPLAAFAARSGLREFALRQWVDALGLGSDYRLLTRAEPNVAGKTGVYAWRGAADCPNALINTTDQEVAITTLKLPPRSVAIHPGPASGVAAGWKSPLSGVVRITGRVADADPNGGDGIAWVIEQRQPGGARELASGDIPNGGAQTLAQGKNADRLASLEVKPGDELRLVVLPKENYVCDTTVVEFTIAKADGSPAWDLTRDLLSDPLQGNPHRDGRGNAGTWRFYDAATTRTAQEIAQPGLSESWQRAAASGDRAAIEQAAREFAKGFTLTDARSPFRITNVADETNLSAEARAAIEKFAGELDALKKNPLPPLEYANGAQEGGVPGSPQAGIHDVRVHIRGRYDRLGDMVPRHFPTVLAGEKQQPIPSGSGRPELARWLASPKHPLTARVMVNRVWQHLFGQGIVRTPSNFGKLGERPSNPALLDWLAAAFATRPSAIGTGDRGRESEKERRTRKDSEGAEACGCSCGKSNNPLFLSNRNSLSFPPRFLTFALSRSHSPESEPPRGHPAPNTALGWSIKRLIREILLSSTYQQAAIPRPATLKADPENRLFGRMNRKRLEAEAIRDNLLAVAGNLDPKMGGVATRDFNSPRRTLYQMTVRSDRSGFGPLFDVADSTASVERRTESTVAPQALFVWNDPFVLRQAKMLTERLLREVPSDDCARVTRAYELLYGRPPTMEEMRLGMQFLAPPRAGGLPNAEAMGYRIQSPVHGALADGAGEPASAGFIPCSPLLQHWASRGITNQDARTTSARWQEYCLVLLCANEFIYVD